MIRQYEIKVGNTTLTCDVEESEVMFDIWHEAKITSDDNLIELLHMVAIEGWKGYDKILREIEQARKEG